MWLILRLMPDAFQPRKLAALAAVTALGGGVIGFLIQDATSGGGSATTRAQTSTATATATVVTTTPAVACRPDLAALAVHGCRLLKSDTGSAADPRGLWGRIDCETDSRHRLVTSRGESYRELTVVDGDHVFGERCELGANDYRAKTFALYREGDHRITFLSLRLPPDFPLSTPDWQLVMQMKQTQPSDNGNGTPVLSLQADGGRWRLFHSSSADQSEESVELWSAPATAGRWTRFAFDVVYSQATEKGSIKVYADLNGDGDAADRGEQSPGIATYTLKRETGAPGGDAIAPGTSIPSHLRVGVYHKPAIACPAPRGCAVDVDDVQVYEAP
jgi:hypothetical protein